MSGKVNSLLLAATLTLLFASNTLLRTVTCVQQQLNTSQHSEDELQVIYRLYPFINLVQ